ncbi:MAG: PLP-dependent transferase, partial [Bacteroidetes bacterium]|nr:PLP-dependent transferase [Bacteroidota bacterium]
MKSPSLETLAVHAGRNDLAELGVHALPIDLSTTYQFTDLQEAVDSLDALVAGEATASNPIYARLHN